MCVCWILWCFRSLSVQKREFKQDIAVLQFCLWNLKLLQFKINYWTVEITCRIAVLIKYISNQKNGGFHSFILDTAGALQRGVEGNYEEDMHYVIYIPVVMKDYAAVTEKWAPHISNMKL